MKNEIRWHYRFENFSRALSLLKKTAESNKPLNDLEQEGVIRRFEYTYELAWKTLRDKLTEDGITISSDTPRYVIKTAFAAKLINNGDAWIDMMKARNEMSHEYDTEKAEKITNQIHMNFLSLLDEAHAKLKAELNES